MAARNSNDDDDDGDETEDERLLNVVVVVVVVMISLGQGGGGEHKGNERGMMDGMIERERKRGWSVSKVRGWRFVSTIAKKRG